MQRRQLLESTLPVNLQVLRQFKGEAELVLLDYNCPEKLKDLISQQFHSDIEAGILKYYRTASPVYFHMSHAKNVSHKLGSGRFVFNLDADNFISTELVETLLSAFQDDNVLAHGSTKRGAMGRIGLSKRRFLEIGGYDEDFIGWGRADKEFLHRALATHKLQEVDVSCFDNYIEHSDELRVHKYGLCDLDANAQVELDEYDITFYNTLCTRNPTLGRHWLRNNLLFKAKTTSNQQVANKGRNWGMSVVQDFYGRSCQT